jgi:hypothetical protein
MRRVRCSCLMVSFHLVKKWLMHRPSLKEITRAKLPGADRASECDDSLAPIEGETRSSPTPSASSEGRRVCYPISPVTSVLKLYNHRGNLFAVIDDTVLVCCCYNCMVILVVGSN